MTRIHHKSEGLEMLYLLMVCFASFGLFVVPDGGSVATEIAEVDGVMADVSIGLPALLASFLLELSPLDSHLHHTLSMKANMSYDILVQLIGSDKPAQMCRLARAFLAPKHRILWLYMKTQTKNFI